jgi:hypothetical protein
MDSTMAFAGEEAKSFDKNDSLKHHLSAGTDLGTMGKNKHPLDR